MKFARRAEGIKSTREVFKKAREDVRTRFHVYVGAALMEYYCTKNKDIAFRIFELGLKKFPDNADYIMAYVDYLSHLNGRDLPLGLSILVSILMFINMYCRSRDIVFFMYFKVLFPCLLGCSSFPVDAKC